MWFLLCSAARREAGSTSGRDYFCGTRTTLAPAGPRRFAAFFLPPFFAAFFLPAFRFMAMTRLRLVPGSDGIGSVMLFAPFCSSGALSLLHAGAVADA